MFSFESSTFLPLVAFAAIMSAAWFVLQSISNRNSRAEDRLERLGRPKSLGDIDIAKKDQESKERFTSLRKKMESFGAALEPTSELEKNSLKTKLANAGFRSETAPQVYRGIKLFTLGLFALPGLAYAMMNGGFTTSNMQILGAAVGVGFYAPSIVLWQLRATRQKEIFLTLPDALDLLVVCVESGLGLDAGMRKVTDEMKGHAKVITDELSLANLQLQMGRPRREVLHDLGVRTGVDDVRSLAAILIQADRFGSSIATALRVQSDSMRTRRRQLAEEKAAKTAVQLIFPLVLFIFPGIFVVLVGPAAINIQKALLK